jgi:3'-5' exoribonuclease
MQLMTLIEIRRAAQSDPVTARAHVQVESAAPKLTREQQPYCELVLVDACDRMTLRVWSDHPAYKTCSALVGEEFIELTAEFHQHSQFGLEARKWTVRPLTEQENRDLLQGPADLRAKQAADWEFVRQTGTAIVDPRLRGLCERFLNEWGDRFRRSAAARNYHHARRGGLVEHTAQMMRVAKEVAPLYPQLNLDLLLAGILFHDSGKLWENQLPENGFIMGYDERGELLTRGKISCLHPKMCVCTCCISSARTTASHNSVRPSAQKRRKRWRSITSTISTRVWKCSPPVTRPGSRWPREFLTVSVHCPATWSNRWRNFSDQR